MTEQYGREMLKNPCQHVVGFALEHIFEASLRKFLPCHEVVGIRPHLLRQPFQQFGNAECGLFAFPAAEPLLHQCHRLGMGQRKALGDVHLADFLGKGVEHGLQDALVAEHHGRAPVVGREVFPHPFAGILRLNGFGRGCRHDDFLLLCQVVEVLLREFVGKGFEVFAQEHTRLMVAAVSRTDIIVVVVPIEPGLSLVLDQSEEGLFHAVEEVEADEGVVFHRGVEFRLSVSKAFHHAAVECAFVGLALFEQGGVEADVELGKDVPQLAVAFAEDVVVLRVEFGEEALQHRLLFVRQKLLLLNLLQVVEVLEEGFGIHHVLVDILEVIENPLCPSVEPVHAYGLLCEFLEESHDVQCRIDAVGHGEVRCQRFEEFADGGVARSPCWAVAGEPEQVFVHIESGTFARKDDYGAAEVAAGLAEEVFCDALEEGCGHLCGVEVESGKRSLSAGAEG